MAQPLEVRRLLARNIRAAVARKKTNIVATAGFAEVSTAHIYDIVGCRKAATIDVIAKIAKALDVTPADLLKPPGDATPAARPHRKIHPSNERRSVR